MPITPLPPPTARLLSSSVAIADPVSLVKELVDNSIDADATTIEVLASQNTIDKIQVKDNGCGIGFEDHDLLGRRACTRKLRTFDELETRGGETLGFRGEALAGANSLATVKITTRTARDPVATLIWLQHGVGGVEKARPVSAPVGTTVQALQLFERLPVRKQNAMKASKKTLGGIKRLLETYALAMPQLKLTFKVLGEPNHAWSYSPLSRTSPREAVTHVFGSLVMTQCVEKSAPLVSGRADGSRGSAWGTLAVILPKLGCHSALIKDKGSFVSVDSRPILSTRGIGKRLATTLKEGLARSLGQQSVASPFMRLSISCNPGSYDANISPLKDEINFKDEQAIVDCFKELCDDVYGRESTDPDNDGSSLSVSQLGRTNTLLSYGISQLEAHVPIRAHTQAPLHENSWVDLEDEMVVDDEELSTILDEAAGYETSAGSKKCSGGCHTTDQGSVQTQSSAEKPDETGNPTTVAMMRTVNHVNLSRKESNQSDQGSTAGLVPVHVAPRRTASPASDHATSGPDGKDPWPTGRRGTIRQYFRRARDQPIEIALDETATSGNSQSSEGSNQCETTRQCEIGRPPLMELTNSDLNAMRDDDELEWLSETEDGFSGLELDDPNAPRGDLNPPLRWRQQAGRAGPRATAPAIGLAADLTLARNTMERILQRGGDQTPPNTLPDEEFDIPRTPPPSNTLRPERISGFRRLGPGLPELGLEGGGTQALSRSRGVSRGDHQGQTSVTTRDGALRNGPRYRPPESDMFSLEGGSLARSSGEELRRPRRRIYNTTGAEYQRDEGDPDQASRTHAPNTIEDLCERACQPDMQTPANQSYAPWSHSSQVMLMRPPPQPSGSDTLSNENHDDGFQIGSTPRIDYGPSPGRASKRPRKRQHSEISTREDEDPRGYYMKRKDLRTRSGRRQRLLSRMLPLERIPTRHETRQLTATIRGGLSVPPQNYVSMLSEIDSPLVFRDMEEASSVEGRLRMVVRLWLDEDKERLVEYTMRLAAKGKQQE